MAVKAGTAYVGIEGDFSALNKQVSSQAGKAFGSKLGKDFTAGFQQGTSGLGSDLGKKASTGKSQMSNAGRSLGREFATNFAASTRSIGQDISASVHRNAIRGIKATAAGVAGAFVYTIKTAADFEQQMSNLGAVTDANTKQMARFEKQALRAGAKTKFSAKEAAQAQTELAKGGLSVKDILSGGLDAALGLAAAGEMDLADAASATVNAMKLFNIRGKDSKKVADAFATAANATTADVSDFAIALSQGGSAAKTAGLSFNDTTGWLEALASSGIKGSDAGTSLKSALIQLSSPTLESSHAMKELGLKFYDAHGNMKDVVEISGMLRDKMGGMTKEQRIQTATQLAGTDGMRGLLALYDAGPKKMSKYEDGLKKQGTAADTSKKKQDNLKGSLENLGGSIETLAINVGTGMLPGIRKATDQLTDFANDVGKIFQRKDLDFGQKVNAVIAKAKIRFGPMANKIEQAIKDAHLDQKLAGVINWATPKILEAVKVVGVKSADALWEGFKAAPLWAKVGGGAFLASKLGLTGPAVKGLMGMLTGKGGGIFSKATPMPVFVVNAAALGGLATGVPGGVPGEEPKGKFGKVGSALGKGAAAVPFLAALVVTFQQLHAEQNAKNLDKLSASTQKVHDTLLESAPDVTDWKNASDAIDLLNGKMGAGPHNLQAMQTALDNFGLSIDSKPEQIKAAADELDHLKGRAQVAQDLLKRGIRLPVDAALDGAKAVRDALDRMSKGGTQDIGSLKTNVRLNMRLIKKTLGEDSLAGKEAISANFSAAITNIKRSMKSGTISVSEGTALIQTYMVRSLMNFGFSKSQALNVAKDPTRRTSFTGGPEEGTRGPGHQRGGYINLGAPTGDSVHAMLERDEYVLNRKAVRKVGKGALDRLNFGMAPRFQKGGSVTGDTDFLPALMNALKALSASVGVPIFVQSGRRTVAEQLAQGPSTAAHPVAGPNGPHVRGVAADITPGFSTFGKAAGKFGLGFTVMPQEPWHIQLVDAAVAAGAKTISAVAQKVAGAKVLGPGSALKTIAQSAIDSTQGAAQGVVNKVFASLAPGVESAVGGGGTATGNGADLMRQISKQRGWSFADWWSLDASETGHGANLSNPTSSARLRGQFLDSNYGKYGPGSDPGKNPSMSAQIYSMAAYIAERYGNPSAAWAFHKSHNYYQRGGPVGALLKRGGGIPSMAKINAAVNKIGNTSRKGKLSDKGKAARTRLMDSLKAIGLPNVVKGLAGHESAVNRFDDFATHAGSLTDTDAISKALEAQQTALGRNLTDAEQDRTIMSMLGRIQGGTQLDWLLKELKALGGWRNALIRARDALQERLATFAKRIQESRDRRDALQDMIANAVRNRQKLVDERDGTRDGKKVKGRKALPKGARRNSVVKQIADLDRDLRVWRLEHTTLGGDNGVIAKLIDKRNTFREALTGSEGVNANLDNIQGSVAGGDKYRIIGNLQGMAQGRLLGTIFDVQESIKNSGIANLRIPAEPVDTGTPDTPVDDDPTKEILAELLRQANLRTAVSEAQFDVFKGLPFGGTFHQGGMVPGPIGAPRMILAQGGEVVIPNDASVGPNVSLHFANGMEWLRQFVSVQVDNQTRTQGRRSERLLPGQGSRR